MPTAAERTPGSASDRTTRPLGSVVRLSLSSRTTVSTSALLLGDERLPGQLHAAAVIHLEQLHLDDVTLLDHVFGLLGAAVLQLADVQKPFDTRQYLHERAECGRALHRTFIGAADFRLGGDGRDHGSGLLTGLSADRRNGDHPGVLDADLGAGSVLNAADRLALRADDVANLVRLDLHRED